MPFTIHLEDSMKYWICYLEISLQYTKIVFLSCDRHCTLLGQDAEESN